MNAATATRRNEQWDVIRGIGIICVVLGHCMPFTIGVHFIFLFHMGLFFFISGYFLKKEKSENINTLGKFTTRKLQTLYVPFLLLNFCVLLIQNWCVSWHMAEVSYHGVDLIKMVLKIFLFCPVDNPLLSQIWFLRSLFISQMIVYVIINFIHSTRIRTIIISFFAITGWLLSYYGVKLPFNMTQNLVICSIIYLGYFIKHTERCDATSKQTIGGGTSLTIMSLMILYISAHYITIDINNSNMSYLGAVQVCTLVGICFCFGLSRIIMKQRLLKNIFSYLGKNSLYIFLLHIIAFKTVSALIVYVYSLPWDAPSKNLYNQIVEDNMGENWWMAYTFAGLSLPLCFVYVKNKVKEMIKI